MRQPYFRVRPSLSFSLRWIGCAVAAYNNGFSHRFYVWNERHIKMVMLAAFLIPCVVIAMGLFRLCINPHCTICII